MKRYLWEGQFWTDDYHIQLKRKERAKADISFSGARLQSLPQSCLLANYDAGNNSLEL